MLSSRRLFVFSCCSASVGFSSVCYASRSALRLEADPFGPFSRTDPSLFRTLLACPIGKAAVAAAAVPSKTAAAATTTTTTGTTTPLTTNATDPLAFVEALAGYLLHHSHHPVQNYIINTTALTILSTLSVQHADGVALLSQSSALVQRLIVRIAKDAAVLYESAFLPRNPPSAPR